MRRERKTRNVQAGYQKEFSGKIYVAALKRAPYFKRPLDRWFTLVEFYKLKLILCGIYKTITLCDQIQKKLVLKNKKKNKFWIKI